MKVKLKIKFKNNNDELTYSAKGILNNGVISYIDNDGTKVSLDTVNDIIKRINGTNKVVLNFKKSKAIINLLEYNNTLILTIYEKQIQKTLNKYVVSYFIDDTEKIYYEINYRKIND